MRSNKLHFLTLSLLALPMLTMTTTATAQSSSAAKSADKFYPGVYSEVEQKMLDEARKPGGSMQPGMQGAAQTSTDSRMELTATLRDMKWYANAFDYYNPLYNNEAYAAKTRYHSIIAVPFFRETGAMFPTLGPKPEIGSWRGTNDGGDLVFLLPIKPGDTFTNLVEPNTVIDETPKEGSTTRTYKVAGTGSLVNQKGEKVITGTMFGTNAFTKTSAAPAAGATSGPGGASGPGGGPDGAGSPGGATGGPGGATGGPSGPGSSNRPMGGMTQHKYTDADWETIHKIENAEKVRGAEILYWEDVKVGDKPAWVIEGPTTVMDMIQMFGLNFISSAPMREKLKTKDQLAGLTQDSYGVYHLFEEGHFTSSERMPRPLHFMALGRNVMVRLATNWIGDDGWLRKVSWRNGSLADDLVNEVPELKGKHISGHGSVGDVLIAKGYVVKKYSEDGDHKADLITWTEDFDGTLCQAARMTVILTSKNAQTAKN